MELLNKLHKICQETTGTLFKISVQANSNNWTLYIFRSKILFVGSLEHVIQSCIDEFLNYRINPIPRTNLESYQPLYKNKYRYLKNSRGEIKMPTKANQIGRKIFRKRERSYKDIYSQKLEFSNSLGYSNFTECFADLGKDEFNKQFKNYQNETAH